MVIATLLSVPVAVLTVKLRTVLPEVKATVPAAVSSIEKLMLLASLNAPVLIVLVVVPAAVISTDGVPDTVNPVLVLVSQTVAAAVFVKTILPVPNDNVRVFEFEDKKFKHVRVRLTRLNVPAVKVTAPVVVTAAEIVTIPELLIIMGLAKVTPFVNIDEVALNVSVPVPVTGWPAFNARPPLPIVKLVVAHVVATPELLKSIPPTVVPVVNVVMDPEAPASITKFTKFAPVPALVIVRVIPLPIAPVNVTVVALLVWPPDPTTILKCVPVVVAVSFMPPDNVLATVLLGAL